MSLVFHNPVLLKEVLEYAALEKAQYILDGTLGGGGHARAILSDFPSIKLIGFDHDKEALEVAQNNLENFKGRAILVQQNFSEAKNVLAELGISQVDTILLDLGISSHQIDTAPRGFSFDKESSLDMRMNQSQEVNATSLVNSASEKTLAMIFKNFGEEPRAKRIASYIIREREKQKILTTTQLKILVKKACMTDDIKPVVRIFQALRIAVNKELENLSLFLKDVISLLRIGGRFLCISYHSLEDRAVKTFMRDNARSCVCPPHYPVCVCNTKAALSIITRKPITPHEDEIKNNRRSRSAKLRVCERIA